MNVKYIINSITLSRIVLGLLFIYVVYFQNANHLYLFMIFAVVAISDFSDGKLARKYNLDSPSGSKLDVYSDFIFIILSTVSLMLINKIDVWYLIIIILEFIEFILTSETPDSFYYEKFGHLVSLMFYSLPIIVLLLDLSKETISILAVFVTLCAVISSFFRIRYKRSKS